MPKRFFSGKILLILILFLAGFLRVYHVGEIPPSLNWDEAALGYNAYSILKTGKDEYGVKFPLTFRSFGDYKPPLYTYFTTPSVAIFGLNEFAVRFPSAFFGTLTVLITYFLVKELFPIHPTSEESRPTSEEGLLALSLEPRALNSWQPLFAAGLTALSPWHVQFSRGAFEANLGLFLAVLGTYLFLKGLKEKTLLPVSALVFALCLYAYHSSRVFVPLLVLSLAFIYRKKLFKLKRWTTISFLIGLILIFPLVKTLVGGETLARFSGVSAFADPGILTRSIEKIEEDNNSLLGRILHNRRIVYTKVFLQNYLNHFAPNFLFIEGDQNPRHHAPANGLLYFWELITVPVGLFVLARTKGKGKLVVFAFLFLAPIAAAPATGAPHAIRSLNSLPAWVIISGFGLTSLVQKTKKAQFLLTIIVLGNFLYWSNLYFIHLPLETSQAWQHGYKEMVGEVSRLEKNYEQVIVTGQYDQPYIFFLFFRKYDPHKYQSEYGNPQELPRYERAFSKYQFLKEVDLSKIDKKDGILIVGTYEEVGQKEDFKTLKRVNFLDGSPAFFIGEKI